VLALSSNLTEKSVSGPKVTGVKTKKAVRKKAKWRQFGAFGNTTRQIWRFPKTTRRHCRSFPLLAREDQAITSATCFAHISKAAFFSAPKS
jgi:hypothetical protein